MHRQPKPGDASALVFSFTASAGVILRPVQLTTSIKNLKSVRKALVCTGPTSYTEPNVDQVLNSYKCHSVSTTLLEGLGYPYA